MNKKLMRILNTALTLSILSTTMFAVESKAENISTDGTYNKQYVEKLNEKYNGAFSEELKNNYQIVGSDKKFFRITHDKNTKKVKETVEISEKDFIIQTADAKLAKLGVTPIQALDDGGQTTTWSNYVNSNWLSLCTYSVRLSDHKYRIKNCFTWSESPYWTLTDAVSVHTNGSFSPISNTQKFEHWYSYSWGSGHKYSPSGYTWLDNGISATFKVCDGWESTYSVGGYIQVDGYCPSGNYYLNAYGNYSHQQTAVDIKPSISVKGANIVCSPTIKFVPASNTNCQFWVY